MGHGNMLADVLAAVGYSCVTCGREVEGEPCGHEDDVLHDGIRFVSCFSWVEPGEARVEELFAAIQMDDQEG
jgi:DNA-directed RNA polymerase subunit RPC12/RpoP